MRIKLNLAAIQPKASLPLSCNYALAALIYKTLSTSSTEFATFLHEQGFAADNRTFKLFTFSRLQPQDAKFNHTSYQLRSPLIEWQISSPVAEFIEHLVTGLFQSEVFHLGPVPLTLQAAETLAPPRFTERMRFRSLSPITEAVRDTEGRIRYLHTDEDWSAIIQRNLLRKYQVLHGREPNDTHLVWQWDQPYLQEIAARGKRASALLDIRGIKVRGWLAPFTVEGSPELIELGYETGFGSRNSMGFGMVEAA